MVRSPIEKVRLFCSTIFCHSTRLTFRHNHPLLCFERARWAWETTRCTVCNLHFFELDEGKREDGCVKSPKWPYGSRRSADKSPLQGDNRGIRSPLIRSHLSRSDGNLLAFRLSPASQRWVGCFSHFQLIFSSTKPLQYRVLLRRVIHLTRFAFSMLLTSRSRRNIRQIKSA